MPLDHDAETLLEMIRVANRPAFEAVGAAEARLLYTAGRKVLAPEPMPVAEIRDLAMPGSLGPIPLRLYRAFSEGVLPVLVFFHGGGWVAGNLETHDGICRRLSNETGCRVIAVDYRLAPEHPFPYGLSDAVAALNHVTRNAELFGLDPKRLGVAGDGTGATLAAVLCRIARDAGSDAIAFQLLLCPILDLQAKSPCHPELGKGHLEEFETFRRDVELYVPAGCDLADVRLSPLRAEEFTGLPPAFIHTAQFDPFGEQGEAYAQRLGGFGVPVHGRCHPGMIHGFYGLPRDIPYALEAMRHIGTEIRYAVRLPPLPERRMTRRIRPELVRI